MSLDPSQRVSGRIAMKFRPSHHRVLIGKWSGSEVKINGEELLIVKESDIMGTIGPVKGSKSKTA